MSFRMGPVLGFQGLENGIWKVGALVVIEGAPPSCTYQADGGILTASAGHIHSEGRFQVWRFDMGVPLASMGQEARYMIAQGPETLSFGFHVPPMDIAPRMAFCSCNGFSSQKLMKDETSREQMANWLVMKEHHDQAPYHLLLMGGDQVYADEMWEIDGPLKDWARMPYAQANAAPFTKEMNVQAREFYFNLYCRRWSQEGMADMFARVPTIMMWDDHDIFDGWGSYLPERQNCAVFTGIFEHAQKAFEIFQRQGILAGNNVCLAAGFGYSLGFDFGKLGLLIPDLRSERAMDQVLSKTHWDLLFNWMKEKDFLHLLFVSSIPVVHPGFGTLETMLGIFPGQQELEDDLADHWTSYGHTGERRRLVMRLLDYAQEENPRTRVTILSGDVHVAAHGVIESNRHGDANASVITQFTSSGIVHPPPAGMVLLAYRQLFEDVDEIERGVVARMMPIPGTKYSFIGMRNWLSIEPDTEPEWLDKPRLWVHWLAVEGSVVRDPKTKQIASKDIKRFTKVVNPAQNLGLA